MTTNARSGIICARCNVKLIMKKARFTYVGHEFEHEVLRCPVCGKVYISPDLAKGKMKEIEELFEEK